MNLTQKILTVLDMAQGLPLTLRHLERFTGVHEPERLNAYLAPLLESGLIGREKYNIKYNSGKRRTVYGYYIMPSGITKIRHDSRKVILKQILEVERIGAEI